MEKSILTLGVLAITAFSFMPVQDKQVQDTASETSINPVRVSGKIIQSPLLANEICDTVPVVKSKKARIDTVYLSPRKQENPKKLKKEVRTEYIKMEDLHKDSSSHKRKDFIYHVDSTMAQVYVYDIDSAKVLTLDTTRIYKIENDNAKLVFSRPQIQSIIVYTLPAPNVTIQPKPLPKPREVKIIELKPAPVPAPKPAAAPAKPKKASKYEPALPAALLKTMNIGKPQEAC